MSNNNKTSNKLTDFINKIDLQLLSKLIVAAVVLIVFTSYITTQYVNQKTQTKKLEEFEEKYSEASNKPSIEGKKVMVHVKGAVKNPNVYELTANDRVKDAIEAAGGFTEDADKQSVNLAEKLSDEMEVYIEYNNEDSASYSVTVKRENSKTQKATTNINAKVNINTASAEQLMTLPQIGPSTAKAIIDYRNYKGSFTSIEQIMRVKGIGNATYLKLKNYITV
jgi:competence protein ComEA